VALLSGRGRSWTKPNVFDSGVVAVHGCCTPDFSARGSWRIQLKCQWRPATSVTHATTVPRRPAVSRRPRCHSCCQVAQSPVRLLGMAFSPRPVVLQNLYMAGFGSAHDVSVRVVIGFGRYVGSRGGGYMPGDRPCTEGTAGNRPLCCKLAMGIRTSVFVPRPRSGVRSGRSVWSNAAAKCTVSLWRTAPRWLRIGPTHYERNAWSSRARANLGS
jgi:hypothetical protein